MQIESEEKPGDKTLGLSPHCDAGSVERWIDKGYQNVYKDIFADNFAKYGQYAAYRNKTQEMNLQQLVMCLEHFKVG